MAEHHYKFDVKMSCGGCSGAIERVLKKLDGKSDHSHFGEGAVYPHRPQQGFPSTPISLVIALTDLQRLGVKSYTVSLEDQTADVTTEEKLAYKDVLAKIQKTGKTVTAGQADGVTMDVE